MKFGLLYNKQQIQAVVLKMAATIN